MKSILAVLLAAAALGVAAPASACDCFWKQLTDDTAPPLQEPLPRSVQAQVIMRDGRGLSQAGFYNDPSIYVGARYDARPGYRPAPHSSGGPYLIQGSDVVQRRY